MWSMWVYGCEFRREDEPGSFWNFFCRHQQLLVRAASEKGDMGDTPQPPEKSW